MIPNAITLAQAGARATRRVPAVALTEPIEVPAPRQPSVGEYFGLFRSCLCGHSSAWHSGAFGEAWRAGEQVRGGCEAEADGAGACRCSAFTEAGLAS